MLVIPSTLPHGYISSVPPFSWNGHHPHTFSMTPHDTMATTKRTRRTGIKQSKYGCVNCKRRKVKCDEKRPGCDNCAKGNRTCTWAPRPGEARHNLQVNTQSYLNVPSTPTAGFPSPARTVTSLRGSPSQAFLNDNLFAINNVAPLPTRDDELIDEACRIVNRTCIDDFHFLPGVINESLFQYNYLCESTRHAAAALVAAPAHFNSVESAQGSDAAANTFSEYSLAVGSLRAELANGCGGSSVPMTIIFLVCVDLMLRRRHNAALHLSQLRSLLNAHSPPLSPDPLQASLDVDILLRSLEIHRIASSDLAVSSEVRPIQIRDLLLPPSDLPSLGRHTINVIHACHAYISRASIDFSQGMLTLDHSSQHSLLIANISQTGSMIAQLLLQPGSDQEIAHLQRLQCICTSMFIELSNLFTVSEESFDNYARQFETIITNAEQILTARRRSRQSELPHFSLQVGIVQPLFLAATKYRRRSWRMRAIACLKNVGQEGPWCGALLAAVAQRCAGFEEACAIPPSVQAAFPEAPQVSTEAIYRNYLSQHSATEEPSSIPAYGRISSIRFIDDSQIKSFPESTGPTFKNPVEDATMTKVLFIQRSGDIPALSARVLSCFDAMQSHICQGILPELLDQQWWHAWSEHISF